MIGPLREHERIVSVVVSRFAVCSVVEEQLDIICG